MKVSELIQHLKEQQELHGDIQVTCEDYEYDTHQIDESVLVTRNNETMLQLQGYAY